MADFDAAGQLTRMKFDGGQVVNQHWRADGRLRSIVTDTQAVLPNYSPDGGLRSVVLTKPEQAKLTRFTRYVKVSFDGKGRISSTMRRAARGG